MRDRSEGDPSPALRAARRARSIAGDESAAGDEARRDAFAALLYGMATTFAGRDDGPDAPPLDERVDTLATILVRDALGLAFRDACRCVAAIAEAIVAARPDPAVIGLVREGAACGGSWLAGDLRDFEARVLRASAPDAFASDRALRPRR